MNGHPSPPIPVMQRWLRWLAQHRRLESFILAIAANLVTAGFLSLVLERLGVIVLDLEELLDISAFILLWVALCFMATWPLWRAHRWARDRQTRGDKFFARGTIYIMGAATYLVIFLLLAGAF